MLKVLQIFRNFTADFVTDRCCDNKTIAETQINHGPITI